MGNVFAAAGVEKPKTHSGFISEFSRRFVKNGLIEAVHGSSLSKLENLRCFADYTLEDIPMEKANTGLRTAEEFVQAVASYLASSKGGE